MFVGDYIDRGPEQVETVRAIMGNYELNASLGPKLVWQVTSLTACI